MITLSIRTDNFDTASTFPFVIEGRRTIRATGYLFAAKGVLYIMKRGTMLCDSYTQKQIAEDERLQSAAPIRHGDTVQVEGQQYKVRILGNYSDAGRLDPV